MSLISPQLKEILVCPTCHGELEEDEAKSVLRCTKDGTEFPVRDGIPIMMVDESGIPMSDAAIRQRSEELIAQENAENPHGK